MKAVSRPPSPSPSSPAASPRSPIPTQHHPPHLQFEVIAAPLEGYSERAFRALCQRYGAHKTVGETTLPPYFFPFVEFFGL